MQLLPRVQRIRTFHSPFFLEPSLIRTPLAFRPDTIARTLLCPIDRISDTSFKVILGLVIRIESTFRSFSEPEYGSPCRAAVFDRYGP